MICALDNLWARVVDSEYQGRVVGATVKLSTTQLAFSS